MTLHGAGRFAPSPSGDLHLGNLRTALVAWLCARTSGRAFALRIDDLDRVRPGSLERQLADLQVIGLDWDGPVVRQGERIDLYREAIGRLVADGRVYECFCTRREIHASASAPHGIDGGYPGTCRALTDSRREHLRSVRPAALRLRADVCEQTVIDEIHGPFTGGVDDLVLQRNDGVPAYNLTTVVDDAAMDVDQVVRGDDLLGSAPRQAYLASLLGLGAPTYAHVPLALAIDGRRLAKRDGAVTLGALRRHGVDAAAAVAMVADSLGLVGRTAVDLLGDFDLAKIPREPWIVRG